MAIDKHKQLARDLLAAVGRFDAEALAGLVTEDIVLNVPGSSCLSGQIPASELPKVMGYLFRLFPQGIRLEVIEVTAEDDRVACRAEAHATTSDGDAYNNEYHFLLRFRDGRICETYEYMDTLLVDRIFGPVVETPAYEGARP